MQKHLLLPSSAFPSSLNKVVTKFWMHHGKIKISDLILTLSVRFLVGTSLIRTRGGVALASDEEGRSLTQEQVPGSSPVPWHSGWCLLLCQHICGFCSSQDWKTIPAGWHPNNPLKKYSKGRLLPLEWPRRE